LIGIAEETAGSKTAPGPDRLNPYVQDPAMMAEVDRLLSGRTRDIRLRGAIGQAFRDRSWRQTAKIIRAWMLWVVFLDEGGACWTVPNPEIRIQNNWSLRRREKIAAV
jgi:hypothetical protein